VNDDRLDLSLIDPTRDRAHRENRVQTIVSRAMAAQRWTVTGQLERWARPAFVLAAATTLFSWVGLALSLRFIEPLAEMESEEAAAVLLSRWAATGAMPSANSLWSVLNARASSV
jgi:hypothetical protein